MLLGKFWVAGVVLLLAGGMAAAITFQPPAGSQQRRAAPLAEDGTGAWPLFHNNLQRNGTTDLQGNIRVPALKWNSRVGGTLWYQSAVLDDIDGDGITEVVMGNTAGRVVAYNADNGRRQWSFAAGETVSGTAAIGDITGDGKPEVVFGSNDNRVYALNGSSGQRLWAFTTRGDVTGSPALVDVNGDGKTDVVVGSGDKSLYAIDGPTGKKIWSLLLGALVAYSSPAITDLDGDGDLDAVIGTSYDKVNDYYPLIVAVDLARGAQIWNFTSPAQYDSFYGTPAVGDVDGNGQPEVVLSDSGSLYALVGATGAVLWEAPGYGSGSVSPALADINGDGALDVVTVTNSGSVVAVDGIDGTQLWSAMLSGGLFSSPAIADIDGDGNMEVIVGAQNSLYSIRADTGRTHWILPLGSTVMASPAVADVDRDGMAEIVVATTNGIMYAVDNLR